MSTYTLVYIHVNECGYFMYPKYNYIYMSVIQIFRDKDLYQCGKN